MSSTKCKSCVWCGLPADHIHHVFYGKNRGNSERYKELCTVPLCWKCHRNLHDNDQAMDDQLKAEAQKRFEAVHGHAAFMAVFGRNYLKELKHGRQTNVYEKNNRE